jgi:hypothetical protein
LLSRSAEGGAVIGSVQLAAALLLAGAGLAKLYAPDQAAAMLRQAWWARLGAGTSRGFVRFGGVVEIGVAVAVIVTGGRVAALLLGCCYLAFLVVAGRLVHRGQHTSCGCFGAADSPVGIGHLVVNLLALAAAVAAAIRPPGVLGGLLDDDALTGAVGVGQAALLAYLAFLSITALPALVAARRRLLEAA